MPRIAADAGQSGLAVPHLWPFWVDRGRVFWNGLQILANVTALAPRR